MTIERSLQEKMNAATKNYLALSKVLMSDVQALLADERKDQHSRRNFVRASAALFEGELHCLREIGVIGLKCGPPPELSPKEKGVLLCESGFNAKDRIRFTLRGIYKMFGLSGPNFGGLEWARAQHLIKKRDSLMHPKTVLDLELPDELWQEMREGVWWLFEQFSAIPRQWPQR